jgi:hypothetical protein
MIIITSLTYFIYKYASSSPKNFLYFSLYFPIYFLSSVRVGFHHFTHSLFLYWPSIETKIYIYILNIVSRGTLKSRWHGIMVRIQYLAKRIDRCLLPERSRGHVGRYCHGDHVIVDHDDQCMECTKCMLCMICTICWECIICSG